MTKLYTEKLGQGEAIVMLHGWAMHTGIWREFAQAIATKNQVICVDLPGHGQSESCASFTLESWANKVLEVFPDEACHIVAWSLGGNIALYLAEKYPKRIKSISLIASNPHFLQENRWPGVGADVLDSFLENLLNNTEVALLRFMSLQVKGQENSKRYLKEIKVIMKECAAPSSQYLEGGLKILQQSDLRKSLQQVVCPVMLILGSIDSLVPVEVVKNCQLLQPNLECHIIEGAGHIPFITHKKQTLDRLNDFLEQGRGS